MTDTNNLTFLEHLKELRNRIIVYTITFLILFLGSFRYSKDILGLIIQPFERTNVIYTSPPELLMTLIKIALITALILSVPMALLQVFLFVKPAFTKKERFGLLLVTFLSLVLLILGIVFGYFVLLPMSLRFFRGIDVNGIRANFILESYLSYVLSLVLMCGVAFELPLVVMALEKLGIVSLERLKKSRKYVLLIMSVISAIITPPDVVSQLILIVPLMGLYEFSIILVKLFTRRKSDK